MVNPKNKGYIKLFACCVPVKGSLRSIICDTQRETYYFIPNGMYFFLQLAENKSIKDAYAKMGKINKPIIDEYVNFLISQELAFFTDSPESFPAIDETLYQSESVNNAILDFNCVSKFNYSKAINELENLGCKAIQLRFFGQLAKLQFESIIKSLNNTSFNSIEIVCSMGKIFTKDSMKDLLENNRRISIIYLYDAHEDAFIDINSDIFKKLILTKQALTGPSDCGCISPSLFSTTLNHILEAKKSNTCLNKKVSIDAAGLIKNCPSMSDSYGLIDNTTISTILKLKKFQKLWAISKDTIDTCKDCEFRYICSDCRAYIQTENINSKPLKCNYDPYSATWN